MTGFETLSVRELKEACAYFGVESEKRTGKENFIFALEQDGISYEDYVLWRAREKGNVDDVLPEIEPVVSKAEPTGPQVLVKMDRANPRYDTYGHTFTKDHPFVLMSENDAQEIFDHEEGFRIATPREASEFYS